MSAAGAALLCRVTLFPQTGSDEMLHGTGDYGDEDVFSGVERHPYANGAVPTFAIPRFP